MKHTARIFECKDGRLTLSDKIQGYEYATIVSGGFASEYGFYCIASVWAIGERFFSLSDDIDTFNAVVQSYIDQDVVGIIFHTP